MAKRLTIQIKSAGEALEGFRETFKAVEAGRRVNKVISGSDLCSRPMMGRLRRT